MSSGLDAGFMLDRQWHWLRGEMDTTKKPALLTLCRTLNGARTPYAIIGGIAVQIHHSEPRTTLDIDVAVPSRDSIPIHALLTAGFHRSGSFEHSDNWTFSDGTPVQFSDDTALADAIASAESLTVDGVTLKVIRAIDLVHEKLRAGRDPARRRSKRLQDLTDAVSLIESHAELLDQLSPQERRVIDEL
jgi:hypothetical protein